MKNYEDFADVTLAIGDDQQIRAHKIILTSGSEFFQNIFMRNPHQNPLLYLNDATCKFLKMIIEFVYTGQCDIEQQDLVQFLSIGKYLWITGLLWDLDNNEVYNHIEDNAADISEVQRRGNIENKYETNYDTDI